MSKIKVEIEGLQTGEKKEIIIDGATPVQAVIMAMTMLDGNNKEES